MEVLVAQVIPQGEEKEEEKERRREGLLQLGGYLDASADEDPPVQVGMLREVVQHSRRNRGLVVEDEADCRLELRERHGSGEASREEVRDAMSGNAAHGHDAGRPHRRFR